MSEKVDEYVRSSHAKGLKDDDIRARLKSIGVDDVEIDAAISGAKSQKTKTETVCKRCGQKFAPGETSCWMCNPDRGVTRFVVSGGQGPRISSGIVLKVMAIICIFALAFFAYDKVSVSDIREGIGSYSKKAAGIVKNTTGKSLPETSGSAGPNRLILGGELGSLEEIAINGPIELDYKTKKEVYEIRGDYVGRHKNLVDGEYAPSQAIFGQIEDRKPWWGLEGQFCRGPGDKSMEGLSEETRFIANPFLLLGIDEGAAYVVQGPCTAIIPNPTRIRWNQNSASGEVTYDLTEFKRQKAASPAFGEAKMEFDFVSMNARDFGYNFMHASRDASDGVEQTSKGMMFSQTAVELRNFLHTGGSCGFKGGCNNGSPDQPELGFKVTKLPAKVTLRLWKDRPSTVEQAADYTWVINFV